MPNYTHDLCKLVTTEMSKVADPADFSTNQKYRDMCRYIEGMLKELILNEPVADMIQVRPCCHRVAVTFTCDPIGEPCVRAMPHYAHTYTLV